MANYFKCKFCDWKIFMWRTNKKGKQTSNYGRLQEHCIVHHNEEIKKLKLLIYEEGGEQNTSK